MKASYFLFPISILGKVLHYLLQLVYPLYEAHPYGSQEHGIGSRLVQMETFAQDFGVYVCRKDNPHRVCCRNAGRYDF